MALRSPRIQLHDSARARNTKYKYLPIELEKTRIVDSRFGAHFPIFICTISCRVPSFQLAALGPDKLPSILALDDPEVKCQQIHLAFIKKL